MNSTKSCLLYTSLHNNLIFDGRQELMNILEEQRVSYAFQPIVDAKTGAVLGLSLIHIYTEENIRGILQYCIEAKVFGIICFGMGLTLREGSREYFYSQLDELFPKMKEKYIKHYGSQYALNSPNNIRLMKLFHQLCEENDIIHDLSLIHICL